MKILLIHLSDIHILNKGSIDNSCVNSIVRSFRSLENFERVIIIISGDIAQSGKPEQYNIAYKMYCKLKNEIKKEYNPQSIDIIIVPGNHDIDFDVKENTKTEYEDIFRQDEQDNFLNKELKKLNSFYNHANGIGCFSDKASTIDMKVLMYNDIKIKINMINTACFSLKSQEDQGYHYLYPFELKKLQRDENDIVITVMHHPYYFFKS